MFVFPRLIADIQKKGKLAFLNIILVFCGCKTAHRKFMFVKTELWDFPVLLTLPVQPVASLYATLTSSMALFCKMVNVSDELPQVLLRLPGQVTEEPK